MEAEKIYPRILKPPPQIVEHFKNKQRAKLPRNKFFRFLKLFFGEGL